MGEPEREMPTAVYALGMIIKELKCLKLTTCRQICTMMQQN